jgi:hypothetical protein
MPYQQRKPRSFGADDIGLLARLFQSRPIFLLESQTGRVSHANKVKKFFSFAVLNFALFLGAAILSSSAQAQSAYVTIQCNDTNNPQINSQSTNSLSLQSGNVTCTAIAYSGIASGYWQYSYNAGPFQYLTGAQVSISYSGIPYGIYQARAIGTDANGNPITSSNVVTINYSASSGGGSSSGTGSASGSGSSSGTGSTSGSGSGSGTGSTSGSGSGSGTGSTSGSGSGSSSGAAQDPGPSASLFNSPYYQCTTNYYVAPNGSDSNNGSSGAPWATLQHADSMNVGAGSCINVAPGTYNGVLIHNGGNAATSTGYVVYRCQQMDQCIVIGNGGYNGTSSFDTVRTTNGTPPNYVQIDGFEMVGQGTFYPVAVNVYNGDNSSKIAGHHIWVLNSIIHGFGQSGIQFNNSEYEYAIHNTLYGNSNTTCDAQGSGISVVGSKTLPGYTPTADDETNPNSLLGPTWQVGSSFFHIVVEWNVTYNNALTQCGSASNPYDTDGNGIIFDTNSSFAGNTGGYTSPMLAAFNISYNNGGGGIHVFRSSNVTVANNTCYNNYLDPYNNGSARACLDDSGGSAVTFINNIAVTNPTVTSTCQFGVAPYTRFNNDIMGGVQSGQALDTFSNNLTDMIGVGCTPQVDMFNGDTYPVPPNIESTAPEWVDVGTSSVGTESTPPVGSNFALAPGSKAIGAGLTEPYLPPSSVDIGACASALTTCP